MMIDAMAFFGRPSEFIEFVVALFEASVSTFYVLIVSGIVCKNFKEQLM